jgi:hypothetical protein
VNQDLESRGFPRRTCPSSATSRRWVDSGIAPVTRRPAWLDEAREHIKAHHPDDGVALSCLYALHGVGFEPEPDDLVEVVESWHIGPDGEVDWHEVVLPEVSR